MRVDQLIADHRMRLIAIVQAAPSVRAGCRQVQIHHSTYYEWLRRLDASGPGGLAPAPRGRAKSPGRVRLEAEVVAWSLANPAWGSRRLFGELRRRGVGVTSESQVWRIQRAHRLNTRPLRYRMIALSQGLHQAEAVLATPPRSKRWVGRLWAEQPGDLVQMDCFWVGRLKEARLGVNKVPGVVWQYTAIDVASSFVWAELHTTAHNPSATHTTALAMRVATDLAAWGWTWARVTTDRGNEFTAHQFRDQLHSLGIEHRPTSPGRPQTNGKVEQVHNTILQEFWKPAWISYTQPSIGGLRTDLADYLHHYNTERPHHGRWNNGQPPTTIIHPKEKLTP